MVHGDVLALSSDALLVPTRNLNNRKWFPSGPLEGAVQPERSAFTPACRVFRVEGGAADRGRSTWLGHLDGRFAPMDRRRGGDDAPELAWFLEAASQFLSKAYADLLARGRAPSCKRAKHVLALPVIGTGKGGARGSSGEMITALLQLLQEFVLSHDVDVALVVKNDRMFSAAQVGAPTHETVLLHSAKRTGPSGWSVPAPRAHVASCVSGAGAPSAALPWMGTEARLTALCCGGGAR